MKHIIYLANYLGLGLFILFVIAVILLLVGTTMAIVYLIKKPKININTTEDKYSKYENHRQAYSQVNFPSEQVPIENPQPIQAPIEKFPYILVNCIFSNKEHKFYNSLRRITYKLNLIVFTKTRIADLVYIPKQTHNYMRWFNYIKAKHVDFVICNTNLKPVLLIEVDDSTHNRPNRKARDEFVDNIFKQLNLPILHIRLWQDEELEKQIKEILGIREIESRI